MKTKTKPPEFHIYIYIFSFSSSLWGVSFFPLTIFYMYFVTVLDWVCSSVVGQEHSMHIWGPGLCAPAAHRMNLSFSWLTSPSFEYSSNVRNFLCEIFSLLKYKDSTLKHSVRMSLNDNEECFWDPWHYHLEVHSLWNLFIRASVPWEPQRAHCFKSKWEA